MNTQTHAHVQSAVAPRPPMANPTPASAGQRPESAPRRLSVWDERARKMGFPPSAR